MSTETILTTARSISTVTAEIKTIVRQTQQIVLNNAMEIGRRLLEAKELVPHGEWGQYLEREVEFSTSTANNMMQLYKEYGNNQMGLWSGNPQAFGEMPYTKALRLLAIPAEEREEFAKEVDAEHISTRELEEEIRKRKQAEAEKQAAQEMQQIAQEQNEALTERAKKGEAERERLQKELDRARQAEAQAKKELDKAQKAEEKAKKAEAQARKEAEEAKAAQQQVPESLMEQLRKDAETAAAEKARAEAEKQVAAAQVQLKEAQQKQQQAEEQLAQSKKNQQLAGEDAVTFKLLFAQVQKDFQKMMEALGKVKAADQETGEKLATAVNALLDKVRGQV